MNRRKQDGRNLLDMMPCRAREWTTASDGRVRVLVPRYGNTSLGRWVARRIGKPHIPVSLDEVGSAIWRACDGSTTVREIARLVSDQFGDKVAPVETRLSRFFSEMERGRLIGWVEQATAAT